MAPAPNMQQLIETIQQDAGSEDVLDQLATASTTVTEINETSDAVLGYFVDRARASGRSWVEISGVLGVTKQAVHKRFASSDFGKQRMERFTRRARNVVEAAPAIAIEAKHGGVGTEHLLLAMYVEPEGIAAKLLEANGLTKERVRARILETAPLGDTVTMNPPLAPRASEGLHGALSEALEFGHNYIGTEHILLGLFRDPEGLACKVMTEFGFDAATARAGVIEALSGYQAKQK